MGDGGGGGGVECGGDGERDDVRGERRRRGDVGVLSGVWWWGVCGVWGEGSVGVGMDVDDGVERLGVCVDVCVGGGDEDEGGVRGGVRRVEGRGEEYVCLVCGECDFV